MTKKRTAKKVTKKTSSRKNKNPDGSCFVLMPFREPFSTYYDAIFDPAVRGANLDPVRGDSLFRPSPIMADVWRMIQDAKVLLAELTTKNANVFYELGLAHAIGKPVVLVAETMDDVPFDLQALRVILYDKNDPEWGKKLRDRIRSSLVETMGDSIEAVPSMYRKRVKSQAPVDSEINLRLDSLERRMNALQDKSLAPSSARLEPHRRRLLEGRLAKAKSIDDIVEAAGWAAAKGMPYEDIKSRLRNYVPPVEVKRILQLLGAPDS